MDPDSLLLIENVSEEMEILTIKEVRGNYYGGNSPLSLEKSGYLQI